MTAPSLSAFELRVMEVLWAHGALSIRQIQELLYEQSSPAYTTVQTIVYRLEKKRAVRRTRKIGSAHIFETVLAPEAPDRRR